MNMSTKSELFINERKEYWTRLSGLIERIYRKGYHSLSVEESLEIPNLYRKICTDAETAHTLKLSPDTLAFIDNLVQQAHNLLYSTQKRTPEKFWRFFTHMFPASFARNWLYIAIVFILFFGSGLTAYLLVINNPELALHILPEAQIEQMRQMYSDDIENSRDLGMNFYMAGFYISNNISIAFLSFCLGITFGLGTIYIIFQNGLTIGTIAAVIVSAGYGKNFGSFVLAHSSFELLGIVLAGGAGLAIGVSMIMTSDEPKLTTIGKKARDVMPIIVVAAFFIFLAAFVEGFISPTGIHIAIKASIAISSAIIVITYSYRVLFLKGARKMVYMLRKR
jgi:uncharacterized membrane protein SpoIIM required for sporulation